MSPTWPRRGSKARSERARDLKCRAWNAEVGVNRCVFLAGASGAIGIRLAPLLIDERAAAWRDRPGGPLEFPG